MLAQTIIQISNENVYKRKKIKRAVMLSVKEKKFKDLTPGEHHFEVVVCSDEVTGFGTFLITKGMDLKNKEWWDLLPVEVTFKVTAKLPPPIAPPSWDL